MWVNNIDVTQLDNGIIQNYDVRLGAPEDPTQFTIPTSLYPSLFDGRVLIEKVWALPYDAYEDRNLSSDQLHEQFKVVMLKNSEVVWESVYTPDLDTNQESIWNRTQLVGGDFVARGLDGVFLEEGVDTIKIVHWQDSEHGENDGGFNSIYPAALCIRYSEPPFPEIPGARCPTSDPEVLLWVNDMDLTDWNASGNIRQYTSPVRLGGQVGPYRFIIPTPYPELLNGGTNIEVEIIDVVASDLFLFRSSMNDQLNEQFKIVFFKDNEVVWQSDYTPDLVSGRRIASWHGELNGDETVFAGGADRIQIIHWGDSQYGGDNHDGENNEGLNALYPVSVCLRVYNPDATAVTFNRTAVLNHNATVFWWISVSLVILSIVVCGTKINLKKLSER